MLKHIILKLLKTKGKEKNLESNLRKITYARERERPFEWLQIPHPKPWRPKDKGTFLKCYIEGIVRPDFYIQQKCLLGMKEKYILD